MESRMWRQMSKMKGHECDHRRFIHSESHQVDLTLRLGFPNGNDNNGNNGNGNGGELPDIDHNKPLFSASLHNNINHQHHALQTHQVMMENNYHGWASSGSRNGDEMMMSSEANYNPQQIVWSQELQSYVLKSNNYNGQLHQVKAGGIIGNSTAPNNISPNNNNLPLQKNNNDLYTLLNPAASRITDDHEAEASSAARRKGNSRRRRASTTNDVEKRCTNYNCNTNFTPMWRKGPLGPKSLCNACGIRYRKETMNREAMAGENSQS